MVKLRRYWRPLTILAVVTLVDFGVRLSSGMRRILVFEAVLFAAGSVLLFWSARRYDAPNPGVRRLDLWLALFFALGSLRAGLWAAGLAVYVANAVVLLVAAIVGIVLLIRRRRQRRVDDLAL